MHRSYQSCSIPPNHPDCNRTSFARPVARGGEGVRYTLPQMAEGPDFTPRALASSISRPVECRKSTLLRPSFAKFPQGNMPLPLPPPSGRAPLVHRCLHHDAWKGPLSDKYDPLHLNAGHRRACCHVINLHVQRDG